MLKVENSIFILKISLLGVLIFFIIMSISTLDKLRVLEVKNSIRNELVAAYINFDGHLLKYSCDNPACAETKFIDFRAKINNINYDFTWEELKTLILTK